MNKQETLNRLVVGFRLSICIDKAGPQDAEDRTTQRVGSLPQELTASLGDGFRKRK